MTIVLTGGGSGGHITPILAVAKELKHLRPDVRLVYVGQTGDQLADIPREHPAIDAVYTVRAGKLRRYHGEGLRQLFDLQTQAKNIRDGVWVLVGLWQSYWLMKRLRPQLIFSRGGFVSVPVCLGGRLAGAPYITHDSDSVPSLANRLIARWAMLHTVALPKEMYPYPKPKTVTVGVPVSDNYVRVTKKLQQQYRKELGLDDHTPVVLVTGGGNGAEPLNLAVVQNVPALLEKQPTLTLLHVAGRNHVATLEHTYDKLLSLPRRAQVKVTGFVTDLYRYSGAADVSVIRAGATNLAELAIQGKACIVIPASQLVGGHQIKNAKVFAEKGAVIMLDESKAAHGALASVVADLLQHDHKRTDLGDRLAEFARPNSARDLAMLLLERGDRH